MIRRLFSTCLLAALLCSLVSAAERPWTLDAIMSLKTVGDPRISPDGLHVAYVVRSEDRQRHAYSSEIRVVEVGRSGKARPLSKPHHSDHSPLWSPTEPGRLAFVSARGGKQQVYVTSLSSGSVQPVTDSATGVGGFAWSPDGKSIGYIATDPAGPEEAARIEIRDDPIVRGENHKYNRIHVVPAGGGAVRLITGRDHHVLSFDWSPDGSRIAYAAQPTPEGRWAFHADIHEVNIKTGMVTDLVTQEGRDASPSYSPDGKQIAFHTQGGTLNYFSERDVALVPAGGGDMRYLRKLYEGDVFRGGDNFWWSRDGSRILFGVGQGTRNRLVEVNLRTKQSAQLPIYPASPSSFTMSRDGTSVAFISAGNESPSEVEVCDLASPQPGQSTELSNCRQVSNVNPQASDYPSLRTETVSWKSKDGSRVEGVLRYPIGYKEGARVPLLVELHGGPTGVATEGYPVPRTYPTQLLAQEGFAILAPNFRGSSNYGGEWRLKNAQSQGFGDFDDVMSGVDYLIEEGIADPDRMGVMGWSYGGYLTSWVIGHTGRFKAASIGAPATDWITYYGEFNGALEVLWTYFGGNPWEHAGNYIRHSSRNGLAANAKTPSLLLHGANDFDHNHEIWQILSDRGVPVEFVTYPREGHGISEPNHQRDMMKRNLEWFKKWVLGNR